MEDKNKVLIEILELFEEIKDFKEGYILYRGCYIGEIKYESKYFKYEITDNITDPTFTRRFETIYDVVDFIMKANENI